MYGIALVPGRRDICDIVSLQNRAARFLSGPSLGQEENIPHLSVLQTTYVEAGLTAERLGELATALTEETDRDYAGYSEGEVENFRRHGYRYIGEQYRPHITLGRTPQEEEFIRPELAEMFDRELAGRRWVPSTLAFYEAGEHGVFARQVAAVQL